jgi:uncharacterized protein Yka (UPF0111/DUF47 family)
MGRLVLSALQTKEHSMSERGDRIRAAGAEARQLLEDVASSVEALAVEVADVVEELEEAGDILRPSDATAEVSKGAE